MNILEKQAKPMPEDDMEGQAPAMEQGEDGEETNPAYVKAKELMLSKLYEDGAADQIAQAMGSAPDPVRGVIDQTMAMLDAMEQATQGSVPDELVMTFVIEVIGEMVEIAQAAKLPIGNTEVAVIVREVLANVVDNLGGDSTAIREEMAQIDPEQVAQQMGGEDGPQPV